MGTRELIRLLACLGYKEGPQVGSRHLKYSHPHPEKLEKGTRTFIIVIQGKNTYDPFWQKEYIRQIKRHGFTRDQIEKCKN